MGLAPDIWIDVLGSMAFTPVKNDMVGNIKVSPLALPTFLQPLGPETD